MTKVTYKLPDEIKALLEQFASLERSVDDLAMRVVDDLENVDAYNTSTIPAKQVKDPVLSAKTKQLISQKEIITKALQAYHDTKVSDAEKEAFRNVVNADYNIQISAAVTRTSSPKAKITTIPIDVDPISATKAKLDLLDKAYKAFGNIDVMVITAYNVIKNILNEDVKNDLSSIDSIEAIHHALFILRTIRDDADLKGKTNYDVDFALNNLGTRVLKIIAKRERAGSDAALPEPITDDLVNNSIAKAVEAVEIERWKLVLRSDVITDSDPKPNINQLPFALIALSEVLDEKAESRPLSSSSPRAVLAAFFSTPSTRSVNSNADEDAQKMNLILDKVEWLLNITKRGAQDLISSPLIPISEALMRPADGKYEEYGDYITNLISAIDRKSQEEPVNEELQNALPQITQQLKALRDRIDDFKLVTKKSRKTPVSPIDKWKSVLSPKKWDGNEPSPPVKEIPDALQALVDISSGRKALARRLTFSSFRTNSKARMSARGSGLGGSDLGRGSDLSKLSQKRIDQILNQLEWVVSQLTALETDDTQKPKLKDSEGNINPNYAEELITWCRDFAARTDITDEDAKTAQGVARSISGDKDNLKALVTIIQERSPELKKASSDQVRLFEAAERKYKAQNDELKIAKEELKRVEQQYNDLIENQAAQRKINEDIIDAIATYNSRREELTDTENRPVGDNTEEDLKKPLIHQKISPEVKEGLVNFRKKKLLEASKKLLEAHGGDISLIGLTNNEEDLNDNLRKVEDELIKIGLEFDANNKIKEPQNLIAMQEQEDLLREIYAELQEVVREKTQELKATGKEVAALQAIINAGIVKKPAPYLTQLVDILEQAANDPDIRPKAQLDQITKELKDLRAQLTKFPVEERKLKAALDKKQKEQKALLNLEDEKAELEEKLVKLDAEIRRGFTKEQVLQGLREEIADMERDLKEFVKSVEDAQANYDRYSLITIHPPVQALMRLEAAKTALAREQRDRGLNAKKEELRREELRVWSGGDVDDAKLERDIRVTDIKLEINGVPNPFTDATIFAPSQKAEALLHVILKLYEQLAGKIESGSPENEINAISSQILRITSDVRNSFITPFLVTEQAVLITDPVAKKNIEDQLFLIKKHKELCADLTMDFSVVDTEVIKRQKEALKIELEERLEQIEVSMATKDQDVARLNLEIAVAERNLEQHKDQEFAVKIEIYEKQKEIKDANITNEESLYELNRLLQMAETLLDVVREGPLVAINKNTLENMSAFRDNPSAKALISKFFNERSFLDISEFEAKCTSLIKTLEKRVNAYFILKDSLKMLERQGLDTILQIPYGVFKRKQAIEAKYDALDATLKDKSVEEIKDEVASSRGGKKHADILHEIRDQFDKLKELLDDYRVIVTENPDEGDRPDSVKIQIEALTAQINAKTEEIRIQKEAAQKLEKDARDTLWYVVEREERRELQMLPAIYKTSAEDKESTHKLSALIAELSEVASLLATHEGASREMFKSPEAAARGESMGVDEILLLASRYYNKAGDYLDQANRVLEIQDTGVIQPAQERLDSLTDEVDDLSRKIREARLRGDSPEKIADLQSSYLRKKAEMEGQERILDFAQKEVDKFRVHVETITMAHGICEQFFDAAQNAKGLSSQPASLDEDIRLQQEEDLRVAINEADLKRQDAFDHLGKAAKAIGDIDKLVRAGKTRRGSMAIDAFVIGAGAVTLRADMDYEREQLRIEKEREKIDRMVPGKAKLVAAGELLKDKIANKFKEDQGRKAVYNIDALIRDADQRIIDKKSQSQDLDKIRALHTNLRNLFRPAVIPVHRKLFDDVVDSLARERSKLPENQDVVEIARLNAEVRRLTAPAPPLNPIDSGQFNDFLTQLAKELKKPSRTPEDDHAIDLLTRQRDNFVDYKRISGTPSYLKTLQDFNRFVGLAPLLPGGTNIDEKVKEFKEYLESHDVSNLELMREIAVFLKDMTGERITFDENGKIIRGVDGKPIYLSTTINTAGHNLEVETLTALSVISLEQINAHVPNAADTLEKQLKEIEKLKLRVEGASDGLMTVSIIYARKKVLTDRGEIEVSDEDKPIGCRVVPTDPDNRIIIDGTNVLLRAEVDLEIDWAKDPKDVKKQLDKVQRLKVQVERLSDQRITLMPTNYLTKTDPVSGLLVPDTDKPAIFSLATTEVRVVGERPILPLKGAPLTVVVDADKTPLLLDSNILIKDGVINGNSGPTVINIETGDVGELKKGGLTLQARILAENYELRFGSVSTDMALDQIHLQYNEAREDVLFNLAKYKVEPTIPATLEYDDATKVDFLVRTALMSSNRFLADAKEAESTAIESIYDLRLEETLFRVFGKELFQREGDVKGVMSVNLVGFLETLLDGYERIEGLRELARTLLDADGKFQPAVINDFLADNQVLEATPGTSQNVHKLDSAFIARLQSIANSRQSDATKNQLITALCSAQIQTVKSREKFKTEVVENFIKKDSRFSEEFVENILTAINPANTAPLAIDPEDREKVDRLDELNGRWEDILAEFSAILSATPVDQVMLKARANALRLELQEIYEISSANVNKMIEAAINNDADISHIINEEIKLIVIARECKIELDIIEQQEVGRKASKLNELRDNWGDLLAEFAAKTISESQLRDEFHKYGVRPAIINTLIDAAKNNEDIIPIISSEISSIVELKREARLNTILTLPSDLEDLMADLKARFIAKSKFRFSDDPVYVISKEMGVRENVAIDINNALELGDNARLQQILAAEKRRIDSIVDANGYKLPKHVSDQLKERLEFFGKDVGTINADLLKIRTSIVQDREQFERAGVLSENQIHDLLASSYGISVPGINNILDILDDYNNGRINNQNVAEALLKAVYESEGKLVYSEESTLIKKMFDLGKAWESGGKSSSEAVIMMVSSMSPELRAIGETDEAKAARELPKDLALVKLRERVGIKDITPEELKARIADIENNPAYTPDEKKQKIEDLIHSKTSSPKERDAALKQQMTVEYEKNLNPALEKLERSYEQIILLEANIDLALADIGLATEKRDALEQAKIKVMADKAEIKERRDNIVRFLESKQLDEQQDKKTKEEWWEKRREENPVQDINIDNKAPLKTPSSHPAHAEASPIADIDIIKRVVKEWMKGTLEYKDMKLWEKDIINILKEALNHKGSPYAGVGLNVETDVRKSNLRIAEIYEMEKERFFVNGTPLANPDFLTDKSIVSLKIGKRFVKVGNGKDMISPSDVVRIFRDNSRNRSDITFQVMGRRGTVTEVTCAKGNNDIYVDTTCGSKKLATDLKESGLKGRALTVDDIDKYGLGVFNCRTNDNKFVEKCTAVIEQVRALGQLDGTRTASMI